MFQENIRWVPNSPYVLRSGKHAGETLEHVLLHNISDFLGMKQQLEKNVADQFHPNNYQRHLQWLVTKINQLAAETYCSECGQPACRLPVVGNNKKGHIFSARPLCDSCLEKSIWYKSTMIRLPWSFNFRTKTNQKRAWEAIKATLDIPKKISDQEFFEFLITQ